MGVPSQAIAASTLPASIPDQGQIPHPWETMRQGVVIFRDRTLLHSLTQIPTISEDVLRAMQQLVELIRMLRSPEQGWNSNHPLSPEALIPYSSDEAHDLITLLQQNPSLHPQQEPTPSPPVLIETLMPELLWCIARSAYPTMQLIEGVRAQASQTENSWTSGILRLAVLLAVKTETAEWCLDLAMGHPPQQFVEENCQIQLEEDWFLQTSSEAELLLAEPASQPLPWLTTQLQTLTETLISTTPVLQSWLQGLSVELMLPGGYWQSGELRLKLGFEFVPYELDDLPLMGVAAFSQAIDAELLDEPGTATGQHEIADSLRLENPPLTPVAVVEMPLPALMTTTIVQLANPDTRETIARLATQRELAKSVNLLRLLPLIQPAEDCVGQVVRQAYRLSELTYHSASSNFSLLQPELLIDELLPKLLWHISRSSYLGMQWLGGVPATILQPTVDWKIGTLRLMVVLELKAAAERWLIDLAAGRFVESEGSGMDAIAIAQIHGSSAFPEPLLIQSLQAQLLQSIQATAPEIALLMQGVAVEWLTRSHDWNPGMLTLHASLEFSSNLFE
ncbi:MAG: hypothetical protein IGS48_18835 [Oscillatoriales cyanobacterium C42_A2020_001]|nr:hypothetical protein [Leptolyngbyaceae cyanobacterium C42_A2020_001]